MKGSSQKEQQRYGSTVLDLRVFNVVVHTRVHLKGRDGRPLKQYALNPTMAPDRASEDPPNSTTKMRLWESTRPSMSE